MKSLESMNQKWSIWIGLIGLAWLGLSGCQFSGETEISTELIHIPATARTEGNPAHLAPVIAFSDTAASLGIVAEGTQIEHTFSFSNEGQAPLILADVSTSCGCTLAEQWPRSPINPGESEQIIIRFDSRGRIGKNRKEIFVVTNASPSTTTLVITAEVIGPQ